MSNTTVTLTRANARRADRLAKHKGVSRDALVAEMLTGPLKEADEALTRQRQEREAWLLTPAGQRQAAHWEAMRRHGIRQYSISSWSPGWMLRIERMDNTHENRHVTKAELDAFLAGLSEGAQP